MADISYQIHTFGCKVNSYDSGLLEQRFVGQGFQPMKSGASAKSVHDKKPPHGCVHILNTCAVTAEATKEALRRVRKIKARDPFALVVVTGCAAQVDTGHFTEVPGVDLVVANSHKGQLEFIIQQHFKGQLQERVFKSNIFKKLDLEGGGGLHSERTRAFLKIQDGCNSFCTFCVIPFARGKSRSLPVSHLIERIRQICDQGVSEIVLTGVHIGDYYDEDTGKKIEDLVADILKYTPLERLRLSSLEPVELSERLLDLYSDSRLCPHFHMSIQSAQSRVLREMKRNYSAEDVETSLLAIEKKLPQAFVGMDVIAGFPSETESEFMETYNRLAALPWTRIHVFPYSPRPGVYANRLQGQLPREEILLRAQQLRELSRNRYELRALDQLGQKKRVLLLTKNKDQIRGVSHDYWPVVFSEKPSDMNKNSEVWAQVVGLDESQDHRMDKHLLVKAC